MSEVCRFDPSVFMVPVTPMLDGEVACYAHTCGGRVLDFDYGGAVPLTPGAHVHWCVPAADADGTLGPGDNYPDAWRDAITAARLPLPGFLREWYDFEGTR